MVVTPPLLLSVGLATVQEGNNVREILLPGKRRFYLVGRCETLGVMAPMVSATESPRVYTTVPDVCVVTLARVEGLYSSSRLTVIDYLFRLQPSSYYGVPVCRFLELINLKSQPYLQ